jgi:transcriptional regulator
VITQTYKENRETLTDASKEVNLEVNSDKTTYMLPSRRHQNAGENNDIKIATRSFENVAQFKYSATKVTNRNSIKKEIEIKYG